MLLNYVYLKLERPGRNNPKLRDFSLPQKVHQYIETTAAPKIMPNASKMNYAGALSGTDTAPTGLQSSSTPINSNENPPTFGQNTDTRKFSSYFIL